MEGRDRGGAKRQLGSIFVANLLKERIEERSLW